MMIKHIVFFKHEDVEVIEHLKKMIDQLPQTIDEIKYFETGLNISDSKNAYDLSLVSAFSSNEDLNTYRIHGEHQKVITYIVDKGIKTKVVDYNF